MGADGGGYAPLIGGPADTLPAAPENEDGPDWAASPLASDSPAAAPALVASPPRPEPARVALSPAQGLTRDAALRQPLIAIRPGFWHPWRAMWSLNPPCAAPVATPSVSPHTAGGQPN